jgi:hypothetical protein
VVLAVLRRPTLWPEALRFLWSVRRKEWPGSLLFVSMPARGYLRWRIGTAYGDPGADPDPADVVRYLQWRRRQRRG